MLASNPSAKPGAEILRRFAWERRGSFNWNTDLGPRASNDGVWGGAPGRLRGSATDAGSPPSHVRCALDCGLQSDKSSIRPVLGQELLRPGFRIHRVGLGKAKNGLSR
jgi:hypothetical protein